MDKSVFGAMALGLVISACSPVVVKLSSRSQTNHIQPATGLNAPTNSVALSNLSVKEGARAEFTGDFWKLTVPDAAQWFSRPTSFELTLVRDNPRSMILLVKTPFSGSLEQFSAINIAELGSAGNGSGALNTKEAITVNGRQSIRIEARVLNDSDVRLLNWIFVTGTEAYALTCGSPLESYAAVRVECLDIAEHFTISQK